MEKAGVVSANEAEMAMYGGRTRKVKVIGFSNGEILRFYIGASIRRPFAGYWLVRELKEVVETCAIFGCSVTH